MMACMYDGRWHIYGNQDKLGSHIPLPSDLLVLSHLCRVCVCNVCLCSMGMCGVHEGQKTAPDTLELEWGIVIRHHVGTGNQTPVLYKSKYLCWARHFSTPISCFIRISLAVCVFKASWSISSTGFSCLHFPTHHSNPGVIDACHHVQVLRIPGIWIRVTRLIWQAQLYTNPSPIPFLLWQGLTM